MSSAEVSSANVRLNIALDYILSFSKGDARPYLEIDILGEKFVGLLDSGATHTIVGATGFKRLKRLGHKHQEISRADCIVANGSSCQVLGHMGLPITLGNKTRPVTALIVPEVKHAIILGIDFWKQMEIIPDFSSGTWEFKTEEEMTNEINSIRVLSAEQQKELEVLLADYSKSMGDEFGHTNMVEHTIETTSAPIKQRYYPVSPVVQKHIDEELDKMLALGVVEPSNSGWSSPILLVPKKDGTYRFCVDFRKLNGVTKKDAYPLPYISSILDRLRNARYLSTLDIKSAYWQIPVAESSRDYLSFTVPGRGLFRFCRMPFGLHNAPATWQRLIDKVLGPELEPWVFVYLDDIIIVTSSFEEHCRILKEVLVRLGKANLRLSLDKCQLCRSELKYLGYVVNEQGIHVDPDKVSAILELSAPTNVKEVRRILGMASWYRRFIRNFAALTEPLTNLLRKSVKFRWSEESEASFQAIKSALVTAPILSCPDFSQPFVLQTDASSYGLGAVLTQGTGDNERVICYLSRSLSSSERVFSVTEKECLAVIWAIEKLRPYLEGASFSVITDHFSLVWLANLRDPHGRLARWAVRLQQFDFKIIHRKGKDHVVPDSLSRGVPKTYTEAVEILDIVPDPWVLKMIADVKRRPRKFPLWRVDGEKLYKQVRLPFPALASPEDHWKLVPHKYQRQELIRLAHDIPISGHGGVTKTFSRLQEKFYWPKMRPDVSKYIRECKICQQCKVEQKLPAGLMLPQPRCDRPWQMISVDLFGPLPRSNAGNTYIFGVSDYFSKFVRLFPLRVANAKSVCKRLEEEVFLLFGVPQVIILDNGKQFVSKACKDLCARYGVQMRFDCNYHAQANPFERVNRVVKTMLSCYVKDNHRTWDVELAKINCAICTSKHEVTGHSPYFVNFGKNQVLHGSDHVPQLDPENITFDHSTVESRPRAFEELYRDICRRIKKASQKSQHHYNLRHRDVVYQIGEKVWRKNFALSDAANYFTAKLSPRYIGPFRVKKKISMWAYELEDDRGNSKGIWNVKDLKRAILPEDDV